MPASSAKGTNTRVIMQNALKTLAANIRFASVDTPIKTLVVTSSVPNEGKSFVALELARTLASGSKDVLLVECDMHRRTLAGALGVHPPMGLYAVLSGQASLEEAVAQTDAKGLFFLDCEPHIPNPADILASRRFHHLTERVRDAYDYVIFDTPPLSAFVDAAVLGSVVDGTLLVVFGGSLGAHHLNTRMASLKRDLLAIPGLHVLHATGADDLEATREALALTPTEAARYRVQGYIDDMGDVLAAADLVLSRAGASSIAEIAALAVPAVLVPYPFATADHQTTNAHTLVDAGAAVMFADADIDSPAFADELLGLLRDPARRARMREASAGLGQAQAAERLADELERLV